MGFANTNRFNILAHIEWEKPMVATLRNALIKRFKISEKEAKKRVITFDIQKTDELINGSWSDKTFKIYGSDNDESVNQFGLNGVISGKKIDVIFGGPPCQAYSLAGRAQDKHSMKHD